MNYYFSEMDIFPFHFMQYKYPIKNKMNVYNQTQIQNGVYVAKRESWKDGSYLV